MDLRTALAILLDWQFLPLAAQVEQTQNVVEDRVPAQFRRGAPTALAQMRQDKLLELRHAQIRWNPLPWLAFRHLEHQSNGILIGPLLSTKTLSCCSLQANSGSEKTRNQLGI